MMTEETTTAAKNTTKGSKTPVKKLVQSEFPVFKINKLPAEGKGRIIWGFNELVKSKDAKRIPADKIDAGRSAAYGHASKNGFQVSIIPERDADGKIIPLMDDKDQPITDKRGNPKPAFYLVIRR